MVLNGEDWLVLQLYAGDRLVVEIDLGDYGSCFLQTFLGSCKSVVVSGDGDRVGFEILDGLVAAAMAELELVGLRSDCVRNDLVAEAIVKFAMTDAEPV